MDDNWFQDEQEEDFLENMFAFDTFTRNTNDLFSDDNGSADVPLFKPHLIPALVRFVGRQRHKHKAH